MNYTELCVDINTSVTQVLEVIEKTHMQAAVVVDEGYLKGTVTDGDVRRYLLKNSNINVPVEMVMCPCPMYERESYSNNSNRELFWKSNRYTISWEMCCRR